MGTSSLYTAQGDLIGYVPGDVVLHHGMASRLRTLLRRAQAVPAHHVDGDDKASFLAKMAPLDDDQWRIVQVGLARAGRVALLGATMEARPHRHHGVLLSALARGVPMDRAQEHDVLAAWALAQAWALEKAYWEGGQEDLDGAPIAVWRWVADLAEQHPSRFLHGFGAPYVSMAALCGTPRGGTPQERAALTLRLVAALQRCAAPVQRMNDLPDARWNAAFAAFCTAPGGPGEPASAPAAPQGHAPPTLLQLQALGAAGGAHTSHHPWHNSLHVVLSLLAGWPPVPTLALGHARGLLPVGLPGSVLDDPTSHKILALAQRLSRLDPGSIRLAAQEALAGLDAMPKIWVDMSACGRMIQQTRALRALFA